MPREGGPTLSVAQLETTYLEGFARLVCGIAPWLELDGVDPSEARLQSEFRAFAQEGLRLAVDPSSPGYLRIGETRQSLVDAAFLALGILRAPNCLWRNLDGETRSRLVEALIRTRDIPPYFNNWLLFSALIESALRFMDVNWDKMRIDYALQQHEQWYAGDGTYCDGEKYHCDYYNSYVIHPFLLAIVDHLPGNWPKLEDWKRRINTRALRYAAILERMICPEGTFPVIGRSITYRFGAFHLVSDLSLRRNLPEGVTPAQVRSALTAVIKRTIGNRSTFDDKGWLRIGLAGHQPGLAESYISTGSLYLCSTVLLPLGLEAKSNFWSAPHAAWTSAKAWNGEAVTADHALIA